MHITGPAAIRAHLEERERNEDLLFTLTARAVKVRGSKRGGAPYHDKWRLGKLEAVASIARAANLAGFCLPDIVV